jgi:hypothetical protein
MICRSAAITLPVPSLIQRVPTVTSSHHPCFHELRQALELEGRAEGRKVGRTYQGKRRESETSKKQKYST